MFCEIYETDIERHALAPEIAGLLALYRSLAESGPVAFERLRAAALPAFGAHVNVMQPEACGAWRIIEVGAGVAALAGHDPTGRTVGEVSGPLDGLLRDLYGRALASGRPVFSIHRADQARHIYLWERLSLPALAADGSPRILDLIRPREHRSDLLNAVLEASCDGIMSLRAVRGEDGRIADAVVLTANRQAAEYVGLEAGALLERRALSTLPNLFPPATWERCLRVMEEGVVERFEMSCTTNGLDTLLRVVAAPLVNGFMMSFSDITDLRYALIEMQLRKEEAERTREELAAEIAARRMVEGELRRIAVTDGLTGVLNRRGFEEVVQKETAAARRYNYPLSVVAIDLDHFKRVNDLHGHSAGDTVLMTVAAMFMEELRSDTDAIGRVGGEEFMILLPHTPASGAAVLAERLRRRLLVFPVRVADATLHMTASFGVRQLGDDGSAEQMMIAADDALYRAKHSGRNAVVVAETVSSAVPRPRAEPNGTRETEAA
jgi:diguanylate cyclase (GGDEF)-like protein